MALNACTINGFTLNSKSCSNKFAYLIPILHPPVVTPVSGTNPRVLRDTFKFVPPPIPQNFELEDQPTLTFEQPIVSVSAEILGFSGTDTQDVSAAQADFVTVTGFDLGVSAEANVVISVNISDLHFE